MAKTNSYKKRADLILPSKDLIVSPEDQLRLDQFLVLKYPAWSRTRLQKLVKNNKVYVDDHFAYAHLKLRTGQRVRVEWPKNKKVLHLSKSSFASPPIIYEDKDIIIVNKPAGLVVHPAAGHFDGNTLVEILAHKLKPGRWPEDVRPGLVHRLDRDTSGVIVMAKTPENQTQLSRQFSLRQVKKVYYGLVKGKMPSKEGTLECRISRDPGSRQRFAVTASGRWAFTKFTLRESFGDEASFVELRPLTGRTHQLRVQLASLGHPILGDYVYGNKEKFGKIPRQMLHAFELQLTHPKTKKSVKFNAPLPDDFQETLKLIRLSS